MKKFTVPQIMQFILANYDRARDWDAVDLFNWVCWNAEQGFLMGIEDKTLRGLIIVRPTMKPEECPSTLLFDPEGDTLFVDLAIALPPKKQTLQGLAMIVLNRFGQRAKVAFQSQGQGPIIVRDAIADTNKLMRTLQYGNT